MSIRALTWALDEAPAELSSPERFVLVALADHVDDETRRAWPSVARIARRTGLSRRSVQRALRALEGLGIITCAHQQGPTGPRADLRPNLYLWHPERATGDPAGPVDNYRDGAPDSHPVDPERGATVTPGATVTRPGRHPDALTVIEPSDTTLSGTGSQSPTPSQESTGDTWLESAIEAGWSEVDGSPDTDDEGPSARYTDRAEEARRALRARQDEERPAEVGATA